MSLLQIAVRDLPEEGFSMIGKDGLMKARIALSIVLGIDVFIALSIADAHFTSPGHRPRRLRLPG
jgi:hypothetical protein